MPLGPLAPAAPAGAGSARAGPATVDGLGRARRERRRLPRLPTDDSPCGAPGRRRSGPGRLGLRRRAPSRCIAAIARSPREPRAGMRPTCRAKSIRSKSMRRRASRPSRYSWKSTPSNSARRPVGAKPGGSSGPVNVAVPRQWNAALRLPGRRTVPRPARTSGPAAHATPRSRTPGRRLPAHLRRPGRVVVDDVVRHEPEQPIGVVAVPCRQIVLGVRTQPLEVDAGLRCPRYRGNTACSVRCLRASVLRGQPDSGDGGGGIGAGRFAGWGRAVAGSNPVSPMRTRARQRRGSPTTVGLSSRARVADSVSRWLDWTEANRTL